MTTISNPCQYGHSLERWWTPRLQCTCAHCAPPPDADLRYLECSRCPLEIRPEDPAFESLWAEAPAG